uniref:DNA-directed RNA polymerase subunit beta' n=1 Tax=Chloromonas radiata TaxID=47907 RepID=A0A0S2IC77_9CHLO|nr:beta' subunit of RNA polymerase [Chloromonas radiata]
MEKENLLEKSFYTSYSKLTEIKLITIGLASPERIRRWAEKILPNGKVIGQVTNANTLHHKTFKPQKGGLFCERIFGPLKDFECACGKTQKPSDTEKKSLAEGKLSFKGNQPSQNKDQISLTSIEEFKNLELFEFFNAADFKESKKTLLEELKRKQNSILERNVYKRKYCPDCDVEYTWSIIRRYQLGYIDLVTPVTHVWYLKATPSYLSILLDIKKKHLEHIVYCAETMTLENSIRFFSFFNYLGWSSEAGTTSFFACAAPSFGRQRRIASLQEWHRHSKTEKKKLAWASKLAEAQFTLNKKKKIFLKQLSEGSCLDFSYTNKQSHKKAPLACYFLPLFNLSGTARGGLGKLFPKHLNSSLKSFFRRAKRSLGAAYAYKRLLKKTSYASSLYKNLSSFLRTAAKKTQFLKEPLIKKNFLRPALSPTSGRRRRRRRRKKSKLLEGVLFFKSLSKRRSRLESIFSCEAFFKLLRSKSLPLLTSRSPFFISDTWIRGKGLVTRTGEDLLSFPFPFLCHSCFALPYWKEEAILRFQAKKEVGDWKDGSKTKGKAKNKPVRLRAWRESSSFSALCSFLFSYKYTKQRTSSKSVNTWYAEGKSCLKGYKNDFSKQLLTSKHQTFLILPEGDGFRKSYFQKLRLLPYTSRGKSCLKRKSGGAALLRQVLITKNFFQKQRTSSSSSSTTGRIAEGKKATKGCKLFLSCLKGSLVKSFGEKNLRPPVKTSRAWAQLRSLLILVSFYQQTFTIAKKKEQNLNYTSYSKPSTLHFTDVEGGSGYEVQDIEGGNEFSREWKEKTGNFDTQIHNSVFSKQLIKKALPYYFFNKKIIKDSYAFTPSASYAATKTQKHSFLDKFLSKLIKVQKNRGLTKNRLLPRLAAEPLFLKKKSLRFFFKKPSFLFLKKQGPKQLLIQKLLIEGFYKQKRKLLEAVFIAVFKAVFIAVFKAAKQLKKAPLFYKLLREKAFLSCLEIGILEILKNLPIQFYILSSIERLAQKKPYYSHLKKHGKLSLKKLIKSLFINLTKFLKKFLISTAKPKIKNFLNNKAFSYAELTPSPFFTFFNMSTYGAKAAYKRSLSIRPAAYKSGGAAWSSFLYFLKQLRCLKLLKRLIYLSKTYFKNHLLSFAYKHVVLSTYISKRQQKLLIPYGDSKAASFFPVGDKLLSVNTFGRSFCCRLEDTIKNLIISLNSIVLSDTNIEVATQITIDKYAFEMINGTDGIIRILAKGLVRSILLSKLLALCTGSPASHSSYKTFYTFGQLKISQKLCLRQATPLFRFKYSFKNSLKSRQAFCFYTKKLVALAFPRPAFLLSLSQNLKLPSASYLKLIKASFARLTKQPCCFWKKCLRKKSLLPLEVKPLEEKKDYKGEWGHAFAEGKLPMLLKTKKALISSLPVPLLPSLPENEGRSGKEGLLLPYTSRKVRSKSGIGKEGLLLPYTSRGVQSKSGTGFKKAFYTAAELKGKKKVNSSTFLKKKWRFSAYKMVNNIYSISHRYRWEHDVDWTDFLEYISAPINFTDIAIPKYEYRVNESFIRNTSDLVPQNAKNQAELYHPSPYYNKGINNKEEDVFIMSKQLSVNTFGSSWPKEEAVEKKLKKFSDLLYFLQKEKVLTLKAAGGYAAYPLSKRTSSKSSSFFLHDLKKEVAAWYAEGFAQFKSLKKLKNKNLLPKVLTLGPTWENLLLFCFFSCKRSKKEKQGIGGTATLLQSKNLAFSGGGLIQKLLTELNFNTSGKNELQKMDKQNRILLYELNKQIHKVKKNFFSLKAKKHFKPVYAKKRIKELIKQRDLLTRRTKLVRKFFISGKTGQSPSSIPSASRAASPKGMILSLLPVLPPDLRPIVKMGNSASNVKIAASDLNRLYQRVIYRNERLKKFLKDPATSNSTSGTEMKFTQGLLQEAVDNLIQNNKSGVPAEKDSRGRALKSLSDILKGKQGRFRQYLLGKRVDYSGRSVIIVGPKLKLHECGIPKEMALSLYLPFLLKRILNYNLAKTVVGAKSLINNNKPLVWELLTEIMQVCPVLLNRAPTLHRLGIQAFIPKLVDGRAILLHPLVCSAFNADFDGDQMAVHVPITIESRAEAWKLMLSRNNLLSPATGDPISVPSQDMVLGCYYLTTISARGTIKKKLLYRLKQNFFTSLPNEVSKGFYFRSEEDVLKAYNQQKIDLHTTVWIRLRRNGFIEDANEIELPIELRITKYGTWKEVNPRSHRNFDYKGNFISHYIKTTPGKIVFNGIIKKLYSLCYLFPRSCCFTSLKIFSFFLSSYILPLIIRLAPYYNIRKHHFLLRVRRKPCRRHGTNFLESLSSLETSCGTAFLAPFLKESKKGASKSAFKKRLKKRL